MTTPAELAASVAGRLGPALTPNLTAADRAWDLYEAYVLTLVVTAAREEGFGVAFESAGRVFPCLAPQVTQ